MKYFFLFSLLFYSFTGVSQDCNLIEAEVYYTQLSKQYLNIEECQKLLDKKDFKAESCENLVLYAEYVIELSNEPYLEKCRFTKDWIVWIGDCGCSKDSTFYEMDMIHLPEIQTFSYHNFQIWKIKRALKK